MSPESQHQVAPGYSRNGIITSVAWAAILGLAAVLGAVILDPPRRQYEAPLFPMVRTAVEGFGLTSLLLLFVAGSVVGRLKRAPWFVIGVSTMALFPILSLVEAIADPKSHNLLPIEWFVYALETAPGLLGAYLATRGHGNEGSVGQASEPVDRS